MKEDHQRIFFAATKPATSHCFDLAHRSLRSAEIQVQRIWNRPGMSAEDPRFIAAISDALIDVHFYFIGLRNLERFLRKVVEDPKFAHLKPKFELLNDAYFKHYSKGREAFEHIDQRLPGEKYEDRLVETLENGVSRKVHYGLRMQSGVFVHSDLTFDISKETFARIQSEVVALFEEVVACCPPSPMGNVGSF